MTQAVIPSTKPTSGYVSIKGAFSVTVAPGACANAGIGAVIVTPTVPSSVKCDLGDIVLVGTGTDLSGVQVTGYVSAQNTIKLVFVNSTSTASITPASATYNIIILPGEAGKFVA